MIKNTVAVILGYLLFGLSAAIVFGLSDIDPSQPASTGFMVLSAIVGGFFAFSGGSLPHPFPGIKQSRPL